MLAAAGVASRRACEVLIAEGHVEVNGRVVRELGTKVDPEKDEIRLDGNKIAARAPEKPVYLMVNKPVGYTSTVSDPHAERTVLELLVQVEERVYPVGRLDVDSEGLLILTNDGEFANRLTHPRYHVPKLYRVRARGFVGKAAATRLAEGIDLDDGKTAPAEVRFIAYDEASQSTTVEITLYEGRNRQVRRMFDAVGNPVRQLTRIGFGNLRLAGLNSGTFRKLRPEEIETLLALAKPTPTPPKEARKPKPHGPYRPPFPARRAGNAVGAPESAEASATPRVPATNPTSPTSPTGFQPQAKEPRRQYDDNFTQATPEPSYQPAKPMAGRPASRPLEPNRPISAPPARPGFASPSPPKPNRDRRNDHHLKPTRPTYDTNHPAYSGYNRGAQQEDDDFTPVRPQAQPARAATPFEKRIAQIARAKAHNTGSPNGVPGRPDSARPQSQDRKPRGAADRPAGSDRPTYPADPRSMGQGTPNRPSPRPKPAYGQAPKGRAPQRPATPDPNGATNNAAGRKAGIPYVPRPKPGFNKFGRAKP